MKNIAFCLILIVINVSVTGQITLEKVLIDKETHKPIPFANIYLQNNYRTGTVSNEDGKFVLKNIKKSSIIQISHISYKTFNFTIDNISEDTITLLPKTEFLPEVIVTNASEKKIIKNVISHLEINYSVENLMYNSYIRELIYEDDMQKLHILSEYLIHVYQNKTDNSKFQIEKMRAKYFSKLGGKYFKDMRVIFGIASCPVNLSRNPPSYLKEKNLKKLNFKIIDETDTTFEIVCFPNKISKNTFFVKNVLLIDKSSWAIKKIVSYRTQDEKYFWERGFKQVNDKWYNSYLKINQKATLLEEWSPNTEILRKIIAIYNINHELKYDKELFKSYINIVAEPVKYHIGNWDDDFWENYNYIPLPEWIKERIDNKN